MSVNTDLSLLVISATKPNGKPAVMLAEMGIKIALIEEDEGNVDRYILSKRVAIERRTGSSFLQGIIDKTLYTSAIYLREHFAVPILIVEGEVSYECRGFNPQAVRGALSSMILVYGLSVLSTPDIDETVNLIAMMTRQEQIGVQEVSLIPKRKATGIADMQRRVVEMLPGCGMTIARDLLQYFGSIKRMVGATEEEIRSLQSIGAKKASEIFKVLNTEYESVDTEKNLEDAIETAPELLFDQPVVLIARQLHIYTDEKERHIVDMVFLNSEANELFLVELKRGRLIEEHYNQIRRYLDNAHKSRFIHAYIEEGTKIHGILATIEKCEFGSKDKDISVCIVDRNRTIEVLKQLRYQRLGL